MITNPQYFRTPFANAGDKDSVPNDTQLDGSVSYTDGYGPDYALEIGVNPDALPLERTKFNEIMFEVTNSLGALQQFAYPEWISSSMNGGSAYAYLKKTRVHYTADSGTTWEVYESLVNNNTATPGTDATKWAVVPSTGTNGLPTASSGGTANAITVTFAPAITSLASPFLCLVRASAASSSTTPTIDINGLGALTFYKGNNQNLASGDIPGAGYWMLVENDPTLGKVQLLNPYLSAASTTVSGSIQIATQSEVNAGTDTVKAVTAATLKNSIGVPSVQYMTIQDQKLNGTDGGTFTSGAWRTRDLNTVVNNNITGASLSANRVTLPAGTYEWVSSCPAVGVESHRARCYSITGSAVLLEGSNSFSRVGGSQGGESIINGIFVVGGSTVIELQHRAANTVASIGFGFPCSFGSELEYYSIVMIRKIV